MKDHEKTVILLFVMVLVLSGCSANMASANANADTNAQNKVEADLVSLTLEQYAERTPYIFSGTCISVKDLHLDQAEVQFKVDKVYQGEPEGTELILRSIDKTPFRRGGKYLIFATKYTSVFVGYDYYVVDALICDGASGIFADAVSGRKYSFSEACSLVEAQVREHGYTGVYELKGDYCRSDDLKDICDYSTHIITAKITGIVIDIADDRNTYSVDIIETLKGDTKGIDWIVASKGLEIGKEYLMLMTKPDDHSRFLVVDSSKSVFGIKDKDAELVKDMYK